MSERKVLNKYYPPDYDPAKIPRLKGAKVNRQWSIRIMAPFNMRCNTCGEYIYKGKKFNSKKETVEDEDYLGLKIFRFYIKCPKCIAEIAFKTDPQNTDYSLEAGASRNFEASKTAEELEKKRLAAIEEEEANNPMKVLENRTKQSMQEMEMIETLEELKEMNTRHARVDHTQMLARHEEYKKQLEKLQEEADEDFIKSLFGKDSERVVKKVTDDGNDDGEPASKKPAFSKMDKPTEILCKEPTKSSLKATVDKKPVWQKSFGGMSKKSALSGLVKRKTPQANTTSSNSGGASHTATSSTASKLVLSGLVKPAASSSTQGSSSSDKVKEDSTAQHCASTDSKDKLTRTDNKANDSGHKASSVGGLGLLGNYTDSEEDSD